MTIADLLLQTRKYSQEKMAELLNVNRNTIASWEKGLTSPSAEQMADWFKVQGINPTSYIIQYCNSIMENIKASDSDEKIEKALIELMLGLSIETKRKLLYILYGSHGSSPTAIIDMVCADLHCHMIDRISVARTIVDNYEIREQRGELIETDHIMPDMDVLKKAVEAGKRAAINGDYGY